MTAGTIYVQDGLLFEATHIEKLDPWVYARGRWWRQGLPGQPVNIQIPVSSITYIQEAEGLPSPPLEDGAPTRVAQRPDPTQASQ